MNLLRLILASFGGFAAYFILGGLIFGLIPSLKSEFLKYPNIYRDQQGQMSHMPLGMAAMFLSMIVLAILYANIGLALTIQSAIAYFVEWTVAGIAIGLIYRPTLVH
jgi:hypothetical protein